MLHRRSLALLLATPFLARGAAAQGAPPPVLFVHGNGDQAPLWVTTMWRFAINGHTALRAANMPDPLARANDAVPQPHRSSSAEQTERLAAMVAEFRAATGAPRIALVGSSRGGYPIRDFVVHQGGAAQVSHAVLCGTPNRGVFDWEFNEGSEFNARSPFLRRLNGGETDVVPGTAFLTIRSDNDLFAQPDGRFVGRPGTPTGITQDGPALRGATNVLLPLLDHREVAFHPRAFAEMFRFIMGREAARLDIPAEAEPVIDGQVTGLEAGAQTNRPVAGAAVAVFRVDDNGQRIAELRRTTTAADGRWGPVTVRPDWALEFEVAAPGHPILHLFRGPYPRSADMLHIRPPAPPAEAERAAASLTRMIRPRGYYGIPRDLVLLDGERPPALREGVAAVWQVARMLPAERIGTPVAGVFNTERVAGRAVPLGENRIAVLELLH
jgi:pimeloyl-ACP methyl ester carboxylesterase